jgi:hypothetical protein
VIGVLSPAAESEEVAVVVGVGVVVMLEVDKEVIIELDPATGASEVLV